MEKRYIGDLMMAAALLAYGAEFEGLDKRNTNRQRFIFTAPPSEIFCTDGNFPVRIENPTFSLFETKYVSELLWLPPGYVSAVRRAKDVIYSHGKE
jgi:hypothetical protein